MGNSNPNPDRTLAFVGVVLAFLAIVVTAGVFIVPFLLQNQGSTTPPAAISPSVTIVVVTATPFLDQQTATFTPQSRPTVTPIQDSRFTVDAKRDWQGTGVQIVKGSEVKVEVIGGEWTKTNGKVPYNMGEGTGYICGRAMTPSNCVELIPLAPTDALIGRIGKQMFIIGQSNTITAEQSGELELRMNDGPSDLYDNDGTLTVNIFASS